MRTYSSVPFSQVTVTTITLRPLRSPPPPARRSPRCAIQASGVRPAERTRP